MAIFIGALLTLLSIGVLLYPFFKPGNALRRQAPAAGSDPAGVESESIESIYDAIQTLQLEHQLGNVPQGLYREQLGAYRLQAALLLRQQAESSGQDSEAVLEEEILLARSTLAYSNGKTVPCANCGAIVNVALAQCPECGVELRPVGGEAAPE